ncbi:MAG: ATP-dependent Clp protease adapter ClpS [Pseudomonadota bacterium]
MQTRFEEILTLAPMNFSMSIPHPRLLPVQAASAHDDGDEGDVLGQALAVVETTKPELKQPRRYQVVILNDDYTPMEFVIEVLLRFFGLNADAATQLMLQVHHHGRAGVGNYSRDVAETKATLVVEYAQQHEHPLLCQAEPML